jgi:hypothetical protein
MSVKTIKSLSKTMRSLEKDNKRLKKSVSALQKCDKDDDDDSSISNVEGSSHFQDALEMLKEYHPRIVLALKHRKFTELDLRNMLLLDNHLAGKVANMLATCRPDSQMSTHLTDMPLSWGHKIDPNTLFLCR